MPPVDPMRQALLDMVTYLQERAVVVAALDQRMIAAETSLRKFDRIVTDGNGKLSILAQLAILDTRNVQTAEDIDGLNARLSEMNRTSVQAKLAIVTALITAIAAVIVALVARF